MAQWSDTTKHSANSFNNGNQYTTDDQMSIEALNNNIENSLYAVRVAENAQSATNNGVSYDLQSGKTDTEKQNARTNIGATSLAEVQNNANTFTKKQTINNDLSVSGKSTSNSSVSNSNILNGTNITSKFYIDSDELVVEETKSNGDTNTYNLSNIYKNFINMSATLLHSGNVSSGTISIPTLWQYKYINIIAVNENSEYASYIWQYDNRKYTKMINSSTKDVNRYVGFRIYSDGIGIMFHENMSIAEIYGIGK